MATFQCVEIFGGVFSVVIWPEKTRSHTAIWLTETTSQFMGHLGWRWWPTSDANWPTNNHLNRRYTWCSSDLVGGGSVSHALLKWRCANILSTLYFCPLLQFLGKGMGSDRNERRMHIFRRLIDRGTSSFRLYISRSWLAVSWLEVGRKSTGTNWNAASIVVVVVGCCSAEIEITCKEFELYILAPLSNGNIWMRLMSNWYWPIGPITSWPIVGFFPLFLSLIAKRRNG